MTAAETTFRWRSIAIPVYGPSLLFALGEGAVLPVIVLSARELGASMAVAAMMTTILGVGSLVSNIPASLITAKYGERWAIVEGSLVAVVGMLCCLFAAALWVYAVGIALLGAATAVYNLARQKYLTEAVPLQFRARALSTLGGMMRVGLFLGPFVGAAVMVWWHLTGAYWVAIVAMVAAAAIGWRLPQLPGRSGEVDRGGPVTVPAVVRSHWRVFVTIGLGVGLLTVMRTCRQAAIPLWGNALELHPTTTSLIYGLAGAVEVLVFYPAGRVMDRRGRMWVAVPALLMMGVAMLAVPLTGDALGLLVVALVLGFGNGISAGLQMTLGADYSPAGGRAQFLGLWRLILDTGSVAGPAALSWLTAVFSLAVGLSAIGGVGLVAAGVLGYFLPRVPRAQ